MALILKAGKTYNYQGIPVASAYGVVDHLNANKLGRIAHIVFEIYANADMRTDSGNIIAQHHYTVGLADFDYWFSIPTLSGQNPFAQAYLYLAALTDEDGNLVWGDWESDEKVTG